ncbi:leucine-rich repeat domain-containing protein [Sphingobacterium spiritivorum]|uniref:leucine-rich repeat domain-containing protein n=1 Tax=Sphingobacterium spiritivorum TaxID=258 RepID=UPI003DA2D6A7
MKQLFSLTLLFLLPVLSICQEIVMSPAVIREVKLKLINDSTLFLNKATEINTFDLDKIKCIEIFALNKESAPLDKDILDKIFNLTPHLEELTLHHNLTKLPEILSPSKKLRILDLSRNKLDSIPESIGRFTTLKILKCDYNEHLKALPSSIVQLSDLELLSLYGTGFEEFPQEIFSLSKLTKLYLAGPLQIGNQVKSPKKINSIPDQFAKLPELTDLSIRYTNISTLPASITKLLKLEELSLSGNAFKTFPDQLKAMKGLVIVDFGNNPVDPKTFINSLHNIKWRGLFYLHDLGLDNVQQEKIQAMLSTIDVYY